MRIINQNTKYRSFRVEKKLAKNYAIPMISNTYAIFFIVDFT